jgi:LysM repeat protein
LPATAPGLSQNEGVFFVTAAEDGTRLIYFIAQNSRHSISVADLQIEQQLNPLWPVRYTGREELLAIAEGAPIANARTGLLGALVAAAPAPEVDEAAAAPEPVGEAVTVEPTAAQSLEPTLAQSVEPSTYVLRKGDNLTHIARDLGTTIEAILAANGISNANRVYAGLTLVIPGTAAVPVEVQAVAEPEPAPVATVAEPEGVADLPDGAEATTYVVKPGDSAILIARRFGVDVDTLLAANGVANRNRVYAGQTLTIPGGA